MAEENDDIMHAFYHTWDDKRHVANAPLEILPGCELVIAFDFGLNPAAVAGQVLASGQIRVLQEWFAEDLALDEFLKKMILPDLQGKFKNLPVLCVGDRAACKSWIRLGERYPKSGGGTTCEDMLNKYGLRFAPVQTNDINRMVWSVSYRLSREIDGKVAYIVDPSCKGLIKGFNGGLKFARIATQFDDNGKTSYHYQMARDVYYHIHTANQYLVLTNDLDFVR